MISMFTGSFGVFCGESTVTVGELAFGRATPLNQFIDYYFDCLLIVLMLLIVCFIVCPNKSNE